MKNIKFFIITSLLIISCENKNNEWSPEVKRNFLDGCFAEANIHAAESSAYSYCDCALVELQKIFAQEDFTKEELKMAMGLQTSEKFNNAFAEVIVKCANRLKN